MPTALKPYLFVPATTEFISGISYLQHGLGVTVSGLTSDKARQDKLAKRAAKGKGTLECPVVD
jgi:hypothetical protein